MSKTGQMNGPRAPSRALFEGLMSRVAVVGALSLAVCSPFSGCSPSRPSSLIDDLRFVAAVGYPPELAPGDTATLRWEFLDAAATSPRTLEYLFLPCTLLPGLSDCLEALELADEPSYVTEEGALTEAGAAEYVRRYSQRGDVVPPSLALSFPVPRSFALLLGGSPPMDTPPGATRAAMPASSPAPGGMTQEYVDASASLLLCAPGGCPMLLAEVDALRAGETPARAAREVLDDLSSGSYLADLERADVSRATRSYRVSLVDQAVRNQSPVLMGVLLDELLQPPGAILEFSSGTLVLLEAQVSEDSVEQYETSLTSDDGSSATPVIEEETLTYRWYSTGGELSQSAGRRPGRGPGGGPPDLTGLTAEEPHQTVFSVPTVTQPTDILLYVVVQDNRLGAHWLSYPVHLVP